MRQFWLLYLSVGAVMVPSLQRAQSPPEREADPRERVAWMMRERAFPAGETAESAILAARRMGIGTAGAAPFLASVAPWRSLGPSGFQNNAYWGSSPQTDGGRITGIAIHPLNPREIFAGSASGGVWRTINGGASWTPLTDSQCSLTTGAIALDPVDPTIVYAGTGEPSQSSGCGLLRSFDAGATWTEINGGGVLAPVSGIGNQTYRIVVDRSTAGSRSSTIVLDATATGLHRSVNSGTSWSTALAGVVTDVRADPSRSGVYWAALTNDAVRAGIYKSTDRGASWARVLASPLGAGRTALAVSPAAPGRVLIAFSVASSYRLGTLVAYDDASGTSTTLAANGLYGATSRGDFGAQSFYDFVLEADPTDAGTIYLGGVRMFRSRDGGATFKVVAHFTHVDWHALEFAPSDPTVIVGGCDGGVHASWDGGETWISRNANLSVSQFYAGLSAHPTFADVLLGGLQDNSTLFGFGSAFWTYVSGGDGGYSAFNPVNPNIFWSSCQVVGCIYRTTRSTSGNGLSVVSRGFSGNDRKRFLPPLVIDPNTPATLYYGTYRLYASYNEGSSWSTISGDLTKGTGAINTIAVAPSDSRVIWVGTSDGNVQVSTDAGLTFGQVAVGLPLRAVTDIAVDAADAQRALVTFSGFGTPHAYLTTNGGTTWTNVSSGLPDLPHNAAVIIPGSNRFFVAGDIGVYESANGGGTWTPAFPGMPNVIVTDLVFQPATGTLYAGTYGRGIFATTVLTGPSVLRGDVNRDGIVNAFDALLVQQALVGVVPSVAQNPSSTGDANCNGRLDSGDALAILQFAVGSAPAALCVGTTR